MITNYKSSAKLPFWEVCAVDQLKMKSRIYYELRKEDVKLLHQAEKRRALKIKYREISAIGRREMALKINTKQIIQNKLLLLQECIIMKWEITEKDVKYKLSFKIIIFSAKGFLSMNWLHVWLCWHSVIC